MILDNIAIPFAKLATLLNAVAAFWTFVLMCFMTIDVISRYFLNQPITGAPEIVKMSMIIFCYFFMSKALWSGRHVRSDLLASKFSERTARWISVLNHFLGSAICALICWASYVPLLKALKYGEYTGEGSMPIQIAPFRIILMIGVGLSAVLYLIRTIQVVQGKSEFS